ncbi:MAG TPA: phosphoglucosamine mutase [Actinomycetota bacterium]|nr:phosphoglucosamine mutase [Actinomycetota bacterium]
MGRLFGTDGVRGVANSQLTPELALRLGRAAAIELGSGGRSPRVVIGRDTRASGPMLQAALAAGVMSAGAEVVDAGVLPTPAVAFWVTTLGASAGAVISASHNPFPDNGIKFFGGDGYKLADDQELRIEQLVDSAGPGAEPGGIGVLSDAGDLYVNHALEALEGRSLAGLRVVLDCSHGAAFRTSPEAFRRAGAELKVINADPDGVNINARCGSQDLGGLVAQVRAAGADLGLAHDGDADRVIAVDEQGREVDGDGLIASLAIELKEAGRLAGNLVVSTVMANLGFRRAMAAAGIDLVETPVGDRYVLERMRRDRASIGGEQSGHVIFSDFSTTGDGLITGLRVAGLMAASGRKLSDLAAVVERFPQVLLNVRVGDAEAAGASEELAQAVQKAQEQLGETGRVLVRPSGTEPLVRVMVEAQDLDTASFVAEELAALIREQTV